MFTGFFPPVPVDQPLTLGHVMKNIALLIISSVSDQILHRVPNTVPTFWLLVLRLTFMNSEVINEVSAGTRDVTNKKIIGWV